MSRLRKGIKYNGGNFANSFKSMVKGGDSPFAVITAGTTEALDLEESDDANDRPVAVATDREKDASTDLVPSNTDYSRSEVGDFFQRVKLAEEKDALEALRDSMNEEEDEGDDEYDPEMRDEDGNLIYTDDYNMDMTGKERRAESRQNKGQIKDKFKEDKADIKSRLSGKEKRQAMKELRGEKRSAKKSNRGQKKVARQDAKCIKLKSKGKTHKSFYRKNCIR